MSEAAIRKYLTFISGVQPVPAGWQTTPSSLLLERGETYATNDRTYAGPRDTPKACFANAARKVFDDSGLTYVEGYIAFKGCPIEHAWVIDEAGFVIDPTLKDGYGIDVYFGVAFPTEYVRETALRTKKWGIINPMSNPQLFEAEALPV